MIKEPSLPQSFSILAGIGPTAFDFKSFQEVEKIRTGMHSFRKEM